MNIKKPVFSNEELAKNKLGCNLYSENYSLTD